MQKKGRTANTDKTAEPPCPDQYKPCCQPIWGRNSALQGEL